MLFLSHKSGNFKSNPTDFKHNIFQGNSLSPVFFVLLFPLTTEHNRTGYR